MNIQWVTWNSMDGMAADLSMRHETLNVLGHAGGVVGCGTADAFHHVDSIPRLAADSTVVLGTSEVGPLLSHLSQLQALCTPA